MNKKTAFEDAIATYPQLKPTRAAGFCLTRDGKGVIISGYDQPISVVVYHPRDLSNLKAMIEVIELGAEMELAAQRNS